MCVCVCVCVCNDASNVLNVFQTGKTEVWDGKMGRCVCDVYVMCCVCDVLCM